jgi:hypothetical protein
MSCEVLASGQQRDHRSWRISSVKVHYQETASQSRWRKLNVCSSNVWSVYISDSIVHACSSELYVWRHFRQKTRDWVMSKNVIIVLIYHRHKPLDHASSFQFRKGLFFIFNSGNGAWSTVTNVIWFLLSYPFQLSFTIFLPFNAI